MRLQERGLFPSNQRLVSLPGAVDSGKQATLMGFRNVVIHIAADVWGPLGGLLQMFSDGVRHATQLDREQRLGARTIT